MFKDRKNLKHFITFSFFWIIFLVPLLFSLMSTFRGSLHFWYDPARDLLAAWDNLKKPTLIGPPTGIPNLFYGPYWIWLLSLGLLISKDPRFVSFVVLTTPYFIIFPLILYKLSQGLFDKRIIAALWLLFILSFIEYTNQLWNPQLAPLLFLIELYLIYKSNLISTKKQDLVAFFLLGIIQGLLLNFHFSFGLAIFLSIILFFVITMVADWIKKRRLTISGLKHIVLFGSGLSITYLPFFLFEYRHGFNQIKAIVYTMSQAAFHNSAVVGQVGLGKTEIINKFAERLPKLLQLPQVTALILSVLLLAGVGLSIKLKWKKTAPDERKILLFLFLNILGILFIYLTSKNPVWDYHFIGTEIIILLLLGILMKKYMWVKRLLFFWAVMLLIPNSVFFIKSFKSSPVKNTDLATEINNVRSIFEDAGGKRFSYTAKNPAIYTYDYDYLFRWLGQTKYSYVPPNNVRETETVYLIIPKSQLADKIGFIDNRTPAQKYLTVREWQGEDGSLIIKRELKKN